MCYPGDESASAQSLRCDVLFRTRTILLPRHENQHAMLSAKLPKSPQVGTSLYANGYNQLMYNVQISCRPPWEAAHLTQGAGMRRKWCCAAATASSEGRPRSERQCIMQFAEAPAVAPAIEQQRVGRPRMLLALLLMQASLCISQQKHITHGSRPGLHHCPCHLQFNLTLEEHNLGCTKWRPAVCAAVHLLHGL